MTSREEDRRERKREAQRRYREKNRERLREWNRLYSQEYRERYPEKVKAGKRAYRLANKEIVDRKAAEWKKNNPEKFEALNKKWRAENRDRLKDYKLRKSYGITLEHYDIIFEEQNGVCAICKTPPQKEYLHVDHDHVTGLVRGLLCQPCNTAIGLLRDEEKNAIAAAEYLKKAKENKWQSMIDRSALE